MKSATKSATKKEIREGAWTTPSGDPIVAVEETDEGDCGYCGDVVYGIIHVTKAGMRLSGKCIAWRYFRSDAGLRSEVWHEECMAWVLYWVQNPNGTLHLKGCRYAREDGTEYHATRGELRHAVGDCFCKSCAPLEAWFSNEPVTYPAPLVAADTQAAQ